MSTLHKADFYNNEWAFRNKGIAEAYRDCSMPETRSPLYPALAPELRGLFRARMRYYAKAAVQDARRNP